MYGLVKTFALRVLKAPTEPPDPPVGSHDSIQIFRASPKYLRYRLLGWTIGMLFLGLTVIAFLVGGAVAGEVGPVVVGGAVGLFALPFAFLTYFSLRIDYEMRYYIVTDRSLRVRQGAITVKEMTITHANVQNLRVVQGPILRLFGIWNLAVDTAGGGASAQGDAGGGHAIQMAGIEDAHEVRDLILRHLKLHGAGAGLGDADDEEDGERGGVVASAELMETLRQLKEVSAGLRAAAGRG